MANPTSIIAIDPGPETSAVLLLASQIITPLPPGDEVPNADVLNYLGLTGAVTSIHRQSLLAIEGIACYGMPVGRETFDTCVWIGRFWQAYGAATLIYRKDIKLHLCGQARAKDPHIRQALIDRFGPGKERAIGTKAAPGPLYGIKSHLWSALAVAITAKDQIAALEGGE